MNMNSQYFNTTYVSTTGQMFIEWETDNSSTNGTGFAADWTSLKGAFSTPLANFNAPASVCVNTPVTFQSLSTGPKLNYAWDFDNNGTIDISDLLFLVNYMFLPPGTVPDPECLLEANIDGLGELPDISDLLYLVDYMFLPPGTAAEPVECP